MPNKKKDHLSLRKNVCCVCFNERGSKPSRCVNLKYEKIIRDCVIEGYLLSDERLPCGVCDRCHFDLLKASKGQEITFSISRQYENIRRYTRQTISETKKIECECAVCLRGRMNGNEWQIFRKNLPTKPGRPVVNKIEKLCAKCFSFIKKGFPHSNDMCKSTRNKLNNLKHMLDEKVKYFLIALLIFLLNLLIYYL